MSDNIAKLTRRVKCVYDYKTQEIMGHHRDSTLSQIKALELEGDTLIYDNQNEIAHDIVALFQRKSIVNIMVLGKVQSGKTGSMLATIKLFLEDSSNLLPSNNIYIITGLSSVEWKNQTKKRVPLNIQARVFHRAELPKTFVDEIRGKKNVLIIMDEVQIAAKQNQTLNRLFKAANLHDKEYLYENDIKILEYTATPDGTLYDLMKWKEASSKLLMEPGAGYIGSYDLLQLGRVQEYQDLCGHKIKKGEVKLVDESSQAHIVALKKHVEGFSTYRYHIIRTQKGALQEVTIANFKKVFGTVRCTYRTHDATRGSEDINDILSSSPVMHTFIFIKELLRCAKTLTKTYLGIVYDRCTVNPNDTVSTQGLVGRGCGYDDNGDSIYFTHIDSINKYRELWNSKFDSTTVKWISPTTKMEDGHLTGSGTFNAPAGGKISTNNNKNENKRICIRFKDRNQFFEKKFWKIVKAELVESVEKKTGPCKSEKWETSNTWIGEKACAKLWRVAKARPVDRREVVELTRSYRAVLEPCYEDKTLNEATLEWWFMLPEEYFKFKSPLLKWHNKLLRYEAGEWKCE